MTSYKGCQAIKMSFASEKLYDGYLRRNMPTIVSKVKVREIIVHLPCLTTHDRENIEAKRETSGNYDGMVLLLECLKRRENWPEQFIQGLEACEHQSLAAEIRKEFDSLRGVNNSGSGSAPATVVKAHVHPAPAASNLPAAESIVGNQPAEAPPQAPPPVQTPAQVAAVSPPEPVSEPPAQDEVPPLPSTPPPSPEIQHAEAADALKPQDKNVPHQEPEENSEPDVQDASGATSSLPQESSSGKMEAAVTAVTPTQLQQQLRLQTAVATNDQPEQSMSSSLVDSDVSDGSSFLTLTPEKHPVQDTAPPVHKVPTDVPQPQRSPEHAAVQSVKRETKAEATSVNSRDVFHENADDSTVCLSKPGQLVSIQPQNPACPPVQACESTMQPYSGNSERLEISEAASDAETRLPACAAVSPEVEKAVSAPPCQENGMAPDHNEPEENQYDSPNQSFGVRENVVQVTGVPSILNLDGQAPVQQNQIVNGEPANESLSADDAVSSPNRHQSESHWHPDLTGDGVSAEPRPLTKSGKTTPPNVGDGDSQSTTRKYILIGAGVGACALLMALKFRK